MSRKTLSPRLIAGIGLTALVGTGMSTGAAMATPTDPIQLAGCDFGRQLSTYNFADYDAYTQRVLDRSTGGFRDQFQRSSIVRRNQAEATHSSSEALSVECSTDTSDAAHAQVIVSVDDTTRSDATFGLPTSEHRVMRVYLDNVGGQWLTERVDPMSN
ncbi:hypothetical protein [Nocardia alni]|uniref:hypothetical protein n=1 Tax=Nocardia alni TaxID=2815723 RepID=UPI001C24CCC3|nr:hypothetical protein [Nocardia alni]